MAAKTDNPEAVAHEAERLAQEALAQAQASVDTLRQAAPLDLPDIERQATADGEDAGGIEMLGDVELQVTVELGRTQMLVEDVLRLTDGSVVELDKLAGDPVDVYVNKRLVARGEVLVLNDNFCIRISEIVADLDAQAHAAARQASQK